MQAPGHPLSVKQLNPLLRVMASVNKAFIRVERFLDAFDSDACPVRLKVPLMVTGACPVPMSCRLCSSWNENGGVFHLDWRAG